MTETVTTCQICGRAIKSKSGVIAHHGYKRPDYGWQTASCYGAKHLPYEQDRERIAEVIEIAKSHLYFQERNLDDFNNNPPAWLPYTTKSFGREMSTINILRPSDFDPSAFRENYIFNSYETQYSNARTKIKRDIDNTKAFITTLIKRFEDWKAPE